jgi:SAM-dependent methyltransferase
MDPAHDHAHDDHGANDHTDDAHAHDRHGHDGDAHAHGDAAHFDARAQDWDDEDKHARSRVIAAAIREEVDVTTATRVLEYGAGTGLTTQFLAAGPVGDVVLADPSRGMRDVMAAKVADGRLPASARISALDLSRDDPPAEQFDLVVTVMALHHIADVERVLAAMAAILAPGGHLCIADLEAEDGSFHAELDHFTGHDGFDREGLTTLLTDAGFRAPTWRHVHEVVKHERPYPVFLATTTRD